VLWGGGEFHSRASPVLTISSDDNERKLVGCGDGSRAEPWVESMSLRDMVISPIALFTGSSSGTAKLRPDGVLGEMAALHGGGAL
jgi:hypothetical protein